MERFNSPDFGEIEFTQERAKHIFTFHPEVRKYRKYFVRAIAQPTFIRKSKSDKMVYILYYRITPREHIAIVIKTNKRNFILTAYATEKISHI